MSAHIKTPLAQSLSKIATAKAADNDQLQGMNLPCTVEEVVSSGIVKVALAVNTDPWTIPSLTVPILYPEYIRYPIQVGDKGALVSMDARTGGLSGLGSGTPLLGDKPGNLAALHFLWIGQTADTWAAPIDPNATEIYGVGSSGAILRDGNSTNVMTVDANGMNLDCTDLGFFGTDPVSQETVSGALSAVVDSAAKAVLQSLITALADYGIIVDGTS